MAALVLLIAFVVVPVAEIYVLIEVGGVIGTVPTIGLIILTAVVGTALIRHQGLGVIAEVRRGIDAGAPPITPLIDGLFLLAAGVLLLTPGFLTDTVGFLCLVPPLRRAAAGALLRWLAEHGHVTVATSRSPGPPDIEADFVDITPERDGRRDDGRSPWLPDDRS